MFQTRKLCNVYFFDFLLEVICFQNLGFLFLFLFFYNLL